MNIALILFGAALGSLLTLAYVAVARLFFRPRREIEEWKEEHHQPEFTNKSNIRRINICP